MLYRVEDLEPGELEDLVKRVNLNEIIDYKCEFVTARNGSIVGVAGVNFNKEVYPRFEHIIVDPKYQKGTLGGRLMFKMEEFIADCGYCRYVSFIMHENPMHDYAKKWIMKPFHTSQKGIWYYKDI